MIYLMMKPMTRSALFFTLLFQWQCVVAFPVDVKADFLFGPDLSRNQACENAREAAKAKAIALVTGEKVSIDQHMYCSQNSKNSDDKRCELKRQTWNLVEGRISKSEVISEVVKSVQGAQVCTVSMVIDVDPPALTADPNFDLKLELNHMSYRPGDALSISIQPTAPMYISIFNWRTAFLNNNVIRLYPNEIDKNNYLTQPLTVPPLTPSPGYKLELEWIAPAEFDKDSMVEWIIVVATQKPITWLPAYDMTRFKEKLLEIPADQRRVVQRSYVLMR